MAEIVRMPKLSDTMTEGVVAAWHKKIGDKETPVYEEKDKDGKLTKDFVQYKVIKDGDKEKILDTAGQNQDSLHKCRFLY